MNAIPVRSDPDERLQRAATRMRDWHFHCWYWGDAIAIDGLLEAQALGVGGCREHVIEVLDRWHRHCLPNFDDALAPGAALLALVMDGALPTTAGERLLQLLEGLPSAYGAVPALEPQRLFFRYGLCIDAIYHLPATYAMAARWRSDPQLARKAVRIALDGMQALQCPTGWSQWFDPTHKRNNGVAWSRGLGWAVLGLLDLLQALDGAGTGIAEVGDLAARVMERLAHTQAADGNWAAVLDHAPAPTETSTATFYVAAALHPAARGLISVSASVLERATAACVRALAGDGTFTGVSTDVLPSWDIKTYEQFHTEPSPWAQGAAVRAFAALARRATA